MTYRSDLYEDARQDALLAFLEEGVLHPTGEQVRGRAKARLRSAFRQEREQHSAFVQAYAVEHADTKLRPHDWYQESRRAEWAETNRRRSHDVAYKKKRAKQRRAMNRHDPRRRYRKQRQRRYNREYRSRLTPERAEAQSAAAVQRVLRAREKNGRKSQAGTQLGRYNDPEFVIRHREAARKHWAKKQAAKKKAL